MRHVTIILKFIRAVARRFSQDACAGRAAGLAFSTIFALVPLGAVVVALLSAFDAFSGILDTANLDLLRELIPAASDEILSSLAEFSENARALGFWALGLFAITAVLLVRGIHRALNAIWGAKSERTLWYRFATYTTVIVLGTGLLAAAAVAGPLVQSMISAGRPESVLRTIVDLLLPPLLLLGTLFLTYVLVPSAGVSARSGFVAAAVAAAGWVVARYVFVFWTGTVMRLSVIYGSLAAVPIFLIWLYITWLIVLGGAEVSVQFEVGTDALFAGPESVESPAVSLPGLSAAVVGAIEEISQRFADGTDPMPEAWLTEQYGARLGELATEALLETGWVARSDRGLLPVRNLAEIELPDLVRRLWLADDDAGRVGEAFLAWAGAAENDPGG